MQPFPLWRHLTTTITMLFQYNFLFKSLFSSETHQTREGNIRQEIVRA